MESLVHTLSWISTALQVPVVVAILYLLLRGVLALGDFYGRWSDRLRRTRAGDALAALPAHELLDQLARSAPRQADPLRQALAALGQAPADAAWHERVVTAFELAADRRLALFRTMTRIGPLLGLMGTLIPLGPALVALAGGDIAVLARKMEVAFATTVVGLVIGALGFLLHQASQRWALDDLSLLEFVSARLRASAP
ncbi:MotA/TolQ/ExbB proton channel family protein [Acidovorax sp. CCYZU-2555]|uniref:MotA/TolQ/ExbB proton channel family protein n=1 Tax=Acidovorax sp. CCYZU-2555 TaxID=2835042 RepID=UPI001BCF4A37|nr:MotA/TolQ/ExbB proton channel family protein [Acidovorax sp. CCYZU-2555]MBS7781415.1 MotA/TolQ/ExbB proton channel family protein [Acidovorax sp. CCYZU-2555]